MSRVVLVFADNEWEALYVDGERIRCGSFFQQSGESMYMLKMAEKYNFKVSDISAHMLSDADEENLDESGLLPKCLKDLSQETLNSTAELFYDEES